MKQRKQRIHSRSGSTLIVVAMLVAAVAMLSLSFLTVLRSSQKENQGSQENLSALYACEAGLTRAMDGLKKGSMGPWGTQNAPASFGEQRYWVSASALSGGRISLVSYGRDDRAQVGVEMIVQPQPQGYFRWAAFGDEIVHMDSNSRTDSYDSSLGSYDSQMVNGSGSDAYANTAGDVGCNANIVVDSNIGVFGDAHPGPAGSVSGNLANITGSTTPLPATIVLPDVVVPSVATTAFTKSDGGTLTSGSYHFGDLSMNPSKTLNIVGPATIVCDNFELESGARISVNAQQGPVQFFVIDDFVLSSNTRIAATDENPANIAISLLSDNILDPGIDVNFDEDVVDFDSGSQMYATIYAPSAQITIDSNFELFGALVARRVELDSNCRIHYDEALPTLNDGAEPVYDTLCWHLLTP